MAQRQVLRAGGRADRVGLDEAELRIARPSVVGLNSERAMA